MAFPQFSALGAKPGRNTILVMACFWRNGLQKHNWKHIPWGIAKNIVTKTQNLTHLWPKARISSFSEWTVGIEIIIARNAADTMESKFPCSETKHIYHVLDERVALFWEEPDLHYGTIRTEQISNHIL